MCVLNIGNIFKNNVHFLDFWELSNIGRQIMTYMDNNEQKQNAKYELFLRLYTKNENRIFGFILTALPNYSMAEDISQETMLVMWRKFEEFKPDSSFVAWGIQIARYEILKFHRNNKRLIIQYNNDVLDKLTGNSDIFTGMDDYILALRNCLNKLSDKNRSMILLRYTQGLKIKAIAEKFNRSLEATYKYMSRMHVSLRQCVEDALTAWEK